jgi:RNA polymerase sigma-70 factor, ECF subfamily
MPNKSESTVQAPGDFTLMLLGDDKPAMLRAAMGLAYHELHDIAVSQIRHERRGHTLQPTDLVNATCLRFIEVGAQFENSAHFFGAAAKAMREICVDGARRRDAIKRGGRWQRVEFTEAERIGFERNDDLLDFDAALKRLATDKPLWSQAAELRVFGGWSTEEMAVILKVAPATARRRWLKARRWLEEALKPDRHGVQADRQPH